jgi:hypothetical protein
MTSKNFTKYTVEILVHDDVDPSELLERVSALAVELAEEHDEENDGLSAALVDEIENATSVCPVPGIS